jgi:hypothetical protein
MVAGVILLILLIIGAALVWPFPHPLTFKVDIPPAAASNR